MFGDKDQHRPDRENLPKTNLKESGFGEASHVNKKPVMKIRKRSGTTFKQSI